jgi:hypothetical protein
MMPEFETSGGHPLKTPVNHTLSRGIYRWQMVARAMLTGSEESQQWVFESGGEDWGRRS